MKTLFENIRKGATPDLAQFVKTLGPNLPLLYQFQNTPQEPAWHAEGDVFVHTQMVLEALYEDLRENPVEPETRLTLVLAALLHDIAKPICTHPVEIQGVQRIAAAGHEARGRSYLLPRILDCGLPYAQLWQIAGLVGEHLLPKMLVKKEKGPEAFLKLARRVSPQLLTRLELADMRGRICADKKEQVEAVELFGMYAESYGAENWEARWQEVLAPAFAHLSPAARDWAFAEALWGAEAGRFQVPEEALYLGHAVAHPLPELLVLVGPSGAGKSTWAERVLGAQGYQILSLDALREELCARRSDQSMNGQVRQLARERLKAHLRAGRKVIWDATNLRRDFRQQVIDIGLAYKALVTLVLFHQSPDSYARGNKNRKHAVPPSVLDAQLERMEWPEVSEAHRLWVLDAAGHRLL